MVVFFCQAEDGIRDLVRSRGLGDVYKRQVLALLTPPRADAHAPEKGEPGVAMMPVARRPLHRGAGALALAASAVLALAIVFPVSYTHLTLPTSDLV